MCNKLKFAAFRSNFGLFLIYIGFFPKIRQRNLLRSDFYLTLYTPDAQEAQKEVNRRMVQIELNNHQAREIAQSIYADIDAYVEEHLSEFEAFLKSERYSESGVNTKS